MQKKIFILFFLSGCTSYRYPVHQKIHAIESQARKTDNYHIIWANGQPEEQYKIPVDGLTLEDALRMALLSDNDLSTQFEKLGVLKSDLIQAGFLSNPNLETIFQFPHTHHTSEESQECQKTYIDVTVSLSLSDFWQIPLHKKIAEKDLAIESLTTLTMILDIIEFTKKAYYQCIYQEEQYETIVSILEQTKQLQTLIKDNNTKNNYLNRYTNDFITTHYTLIESQLLEQKQKLDNAYLNLRSTIYTHISHEPIKLTSPLSTIIKEPNNLDELIEYAKNNAPETHIARLTIQKARHQQSLEKRKILNNVSCGLSYSRDTDGSFLIGPQISIDLPIFNKNQAEIIHAKWLEKEAKNNLNTLELELEAKIKELYYTINSLNTIIKHYEATIAPHIKKIIENNTNIKDTALDPITLIQSQMFLYEQKKTYHQKKLTLAENIINLEKLLAKNI